MRKLLEKTILFILIFIGMMVISNASQASGSLRLRNLNYDVTLNSDGTADVIETWRIRIEDTNTLFKTFKVDTSKYKEITNVKVQEVKTSGNVNFTRINQYKYHVDKNCYYALIYNGKFEIAWGAHAENTTRTYKISYKIIDAVKNYNDCSEFYWQFISTDSAIPADVVEGTIKLPSSVSNIEDLRVWAHGPLHGDIEKISANTVKFKINDLASKTMLEARVVTPTNIFSKNLNKSNTNKLNSILTQEQKWADEANAERERIAKQIETRTRIVIAVFIITNILGLVLTIVIIKKIIKYHKELKNTPIVKPEQEYDYFRDIPDETETPAGVGLLYYFKSSGLQVNMPKIISATMLDLCMKKYIEFEPVENKKNQIKVILKKDEIGDLTSDEKIVYELLKKVPKKEEKSFTMKEFEKYARNHSSSILNTFSKIEDVAKGNEENKENYSKDLIKQANKWSIKGVGYIALFVVSIFIMWILTLPALVASIYCFKISSRYNRLTEKGINEKAKWVGLKKYMEEFSMIDEKTVPELILWEKYLVYATVFGIADKVLKQLKVVYPQITDTEYMNSHGYTYMNLMYSHNFSNSFVSSLNTSLTTSYHSATNYSSGSGGGGGFSHGGGFGGGGGRNGWKIKSCFRQKKRISNEEAIIMTTQNITDFLDKKIAKDENEIVISFYELRVKMNLSQEDVALFLEYSKTRLVNLGYKVFFNGDSFLYNGENRTVQDNELMIAVKNNNC